MKLTDEAGTSHVQNEILFRFFFDLCGNSNGKLPVETTTSVVFVTVDILPMLRSAKIIFPFLLAAFQLLS